jgi:UDP-GlcNAc:undecaprenyl-phosphate/decaprenyl-phosphate GlcNAc-1-phosphate transferase
MGLFLYEYFVCFLLAFITAFTSTPIAKKIAFKCGAIDVPKDNRRMHKKPIARLGGLAIVLGFLVAIAYIVIDLSIQPYSYSFVDYRRWLGILLGIIIIFIIGLIDDINPLPAKLKLFFQIIAALLVSFTGTRIDVVTNPFSSDGLSTLPIYVSLPITIVWIIGITNAINLIDGLDGLAAGVSSIASLSLFIIAVINKQVETAIFTAALAGSSLGFLPFNFNPAKIFMGDTGSTFLGFTLSIVAIQGTVKGYAAIAIAVPLLVLGLPLFDTIITILRRILNKQPIMSADRRHIHHRLVDMGLSHKQSVVVLYTASSALGLCAVVLANKGAISALILVIALSIFTIGGAKYMSEITDNDTEKPKAHTINQKHNK